MKEFLLLSCLGSDVVNKDTACEGRRLICRHLWQPPASSQNTHSLSRFTTSKEGGGAFILHPSALNHYFLQVFFCVFLKRFYGPKYKDSSWCYEVNTDKSIKFLQYSIPLPMSWSDHIFQENAYKKHGRELLRTIIEHFSILHAVFNKVN
jgi:hypothetical protein